MRFAFSSCSDVCFETALNDEFALDNERAASRIFVSRVSFLDSVTSLDDRTWNSYTPPTTTNEIEPNKVQPPVSHDRHAARTFLSSSTSSALSTSYPRLSTIASLESRLISRSSFALNIMLLRLSGSPVFLANSATRAGIGIRGDDGPATGDDGCVDVLPESTESREDWNDELPSSSDLDEAPFVPWRDRSLRKKSAAVPFGGLSSRAAPLVGGDAVGGHEGLGWKFSGLVAGGEDDDDAEGRGDVAEGGVEVAVPPPRKRRTPFICFCGLLAGIRGKKVCCAARC